MCEQHAEIDTNSAKVQTYSAESADFDCFHPKGLQFGEHTTSNRGLTATKRGKRRH